ncbi:hypothetical protein GCM10027605_23710 [Micromonospora zhanjiangensis]
MSPAYSAAPLSTSTRVTSEMVTCSMVAALSPPRMLTCPSRLRPGRVLGLTNTVSTLGPPTPNALSIFLKTIGLLLLTGWGYD